MHKAITRTQKWLTEAVIKYQFCPYAKQPHDKDIIGYRVYAGSDVATLLEMLARCCIELDETLDERASACQNNKTKTLETTLLIISTQNGNVDYLADFYDYLEVLAVVNDFLDTPQAFSNAFSAEFREQYGDRISGSWGEKYQIASFHPDYQFEGTTTVDIENYTNRSPYPTFHIIRNASIEFVRMNDERAEKIVEQNINTINRLSKDSLVILRRLSER